MHESKIPRSMIVESGTVRDPEPMRRDSLRSPALTVSNWTIGNQRIGHASRYSIRAELDDAAREWLARERVAWRKIIRRALGPG